MRQMGVPLQQLPAMSPGDWFVWLFFAPLLLVGVVGIAKGLRALVRSYLTVRREPVPVVGVSNESGTVEVRGTARSAGETTNAPDTDEPCLAYTYETTRSGNHKRIEKEGAVPFRVEDDTGSVVTEPAGAKLLLGGGMGEHTLTAGDEVHVTGTPVEPDGQYDGHAGAVALGDGGGTFLVAANDEDTTATRLKWRGIAAIVKSTVWLGFLTFLLSNGGYM